MVTNLSSSTTNTIGNRAKVYLDPRNRTCQILRESRILGITFRQLDKLIYASSYCSLRPPLWNPSNMALRPGWSALADTVLVLRGHCL